MTTTTEPAVPVRTTVPQPPRVHLPPTRSRRAVLDGGWWPRSWDLPAELPALLGTLGDTYGRIRHVMVNGRVWHGGGARLAVGAGMVRVGRFGTLDPALLIAVTDRDDQLDLLVVPPDTAPDTAERAMAMAADPTGGRHAPDILPAVARLP